MVANWLRKHTFQLLGSRCHLCGVPMHSDEYAAHSGWCKHCCQKLLNPNRCACCGRNLSQPVLQCGRCVNTPPPWRQLYCIGDHAFPLSHYLYKCKYQGQYWFADHLAQLLATQIPQPQPLLICVPMHWRRLWYRGYNQSAQLSHFLGKHLNVPVDNHLFKRLRHTPPQQSLSGRARRLNLRHAFALNHLPTSQHIAIVDDVVTTGSTLLPLCQLLRDAGVETIDIYCISRTPEG